MLYGRQILVTIRIIDRAAVHQEICERIEIAAHCLVELEKRSPMNWRIYGNIGKKAEPKEKVQILALIQQRKLDVRILYTHPVVTTNVITTYNEFAYKLFCIL